MTGFPPRLTLKSRLDPLPIMSDNEDESVAERELESEVRDMNIKGDSDSPQTHIPNGETVVNLAHRQSPTQHAERSTEPTPGVKSENASRAPSPSHSSRSHTKDETSASTPLDRPDSNAGSVSPKYFAA